MSGGSLLSLILFLWLSSIWAILAAFWAAAPYREDSEEQKAEDREQERYLRAWSRRRRSKDKM
jgi:hypothetical protein